MSGISTGVTARDLLYGFLDLQRMASKLEEWTEDKLRENPPRFIRLRRLKALFRAFDIPWNPVAFRTGEFLRRTGDLLEPIDARYMPLLQQIQAEMPDVVRDISTFRRNQIFVMFRILLRYRESLEALLSFSRGVMASSGLHLYAHKKAEEINEVIRPHVSGIDDLLAAIIDPDRRTFPLSHLIQEFGYPEEDLGAIDLDWW